MRTYCPVGAILFDHPDPSIFTVLTAPSGQPGTANIDFALFRERWMAMEDMCLVAQLNNVHRWGVDMTPFDRLLEIEEQALNQPAFDAAHPKKPARRQLKETL